MISVLLEIHEIREIHEIHEIHNPDIFVLQLFLLSHLEESLSSTNLNQPSRTNSSNIFEQW